MKGVEPIRARSAPFLTPRARGVKIANFAIVLERSVRSFRGLEHLF